MAEEASSSKRPILTGFSAAMPTLLALLAPGTINVANGIDATGFLINAFRRADVTRADGLQCPAFAVAGRHKCEHSSN